MIPAASLGFSPPGYTPQLGLFTRATFLSRPVAGQAVGSNSSLMFFGTGMGTSRLLGPGHPPPQRVPGVVRPSLPLVKLESQPLEEAAGVRPAAGRPWMTPNRISPGAGWSGVSGVRTRGCSGPGGWGP